MAKRRAFNPGFRPLSKLESKMIQWCIDNNIACCVVWAQGHSGPGEDFCVEIIINGKSNFSPNFKKQEVMDKQVEYYKYYYDKYNK
tara:strand:- start:743 stop:1000 length:258 start_codon:yes stop_codon:yes gene_type:complete